MAGAGTLTAGTRMAGAGTLTAGNSVQSKNLCRGRIWHFVRKNLVFYACAGNADLI